jgi:hypothetical protein
MTGIKNMISTRQTNLNSEQLIFETIYQAAKEKNAEKIISLDCCVDIQYRGLGTPACVLAKEGNHEAVNFLKTEFNSSLKWISLGYALGADVEKAKETLASLINHPLDYYELHVPDIVFGYGRSGLREQAEIIIRRFENTQQELRLRSALAEGCLQGGYITSANDFLELTSNPNNRYTVLKTLAYRYAYLAKDKEIHNILAMAETPEEKLQFLNEVAKGYGLGGCVHLVNDILTMVTSTRDKLELVRYIVRGYFREGYINEAYAQVESFNPTSKEKHVLLKEMLLGAGQGGHAQLAKQILNQEDKASKRSDLLEFFVYGLARGGHENETYKTIKLAADKEKSLLCKVAIEGFIKGEHISSVNAIFSLLLDDSALPLMLEKAIQYIKNDGEIFISEAMCLHTLVSFDSKIADLFVKKAKTDNEIMTDLSSLITKAARIRQVMISQQINYCMGLAWIQPEVQLWLLQFQQLVQQNKLTMDLYEKILTYLAPMNSLEGKNLQQKLFLKLRRKSFYANYDESAANFTLADIMYEAAKEKHYSKVNALLTKISLNTQLTDGFHIIDKLAIEGNIDAIKFLILNFDISLKYVVHGYVLAGYMDEANNILQSIVDKHERLSLLKWKLFALAKLGNTSDINKLWNEISNPTEEFRLLKWIIRGYALSGFIREAYDALSFLSNQAERFVLLNQMLNGFVRGGFINQATIILSNASNTIEQFILIEEFAYACGLSGKKQAAEDLLKSLPNPAWHRDVLLNLIQGYGFSGHFELAKQIVGLSGSMVYAFATGGYFEQVDNMIASAYIYQRDEFLHKAILGYVNRNNFAEANNLLRLVKDSIKRWNIIKEIAKAYASKGMTNEVNKILNSEVHSRYLNSFLEMIIEGYAKHGYYEQVNKLLFSTPATSQSYDLIPLLCFAACGYASRGYVNEVNNILKYSLSSTKRLKLLKQIVTSYIDNGFVNEANRILTVADDNMQRFSLIKTIITTLQKRKDLATVTSTLQLLSIFSPTLQKTIAEEIDNNKISLTGFSTINIVPATKKLNYLYNSQKLTYKQALVWLRLESQLWLSQGFILVENKKLDIDIYLKIFSYLAFFTNIEAVKLSAKFSKLFCRCRLFKQHIDNDKNFVDQSIQTRNKFVNKSSLNNFVTF